MNQFQIRKDDFTKGRIVETKSLKIDEGEILVKIEHFAFTANNITYAVAGNMIGYWQFFPPIGEDSDGWGVIPVWGFADVVESNVEDIPVGDRLFGYFSPSTFLKMKPVRISEGRFIDGAEHRAQLPVGYNIYRRVKAEPNYSKAMDRERMLLSPLFLTAFCLWDALKDNDWYGAKQVIILSASSKTSIGLAYALHDDEAAPPVVGVTSLRNLELVNKLGLYGKSVTYDDIKNIDASIPTVIVDMSGNAEVMAALHTHLGENMKYHISVGLTHWEDGGTKEGFIKERSEFFFAPGHIQKRLKEWGPAVFDEKSTGFIMRTAGRTRDWLTFKKLDGLTGLTEVYQDVCAGRMSPDEGLVVEL